MESNHVFVIAEAGSNWRMGTPERDMKMAKTLIDIASDAGADAINSRLIVHTLSMFQTLETQITCQNLG